MTATILPEITATFPETLDISRITDGTVSGRGVLDQLLRTMTAHLNTQYEKNRITGTEYANLYLGAYQATLQQGIALALAKEQQSYEINNLIWEAKVKEAQYDLAVKQLEAASYELVNKAPVEIANLTKQGDLLTIQYAIASYELTNLKPEELVLLQKQQTKLNYEIEENIQRIESVVPSQIANMAAERVNLTKQGILLTTQDALGQYDLTTKNPVEVANLLKQGLLQDKEYEIQGKNSLLKNEEITMAQKKILNTIEETLSVIAQKDLYLKKITTETGQTDASAIGADSILDSQRNLMKAQTVGYDRDAEQKVAKIMLDTWVTRVNNDIGEQNNSNLLRDNNIGAAVAKMYQGIGVTPVVGPSGLIPPVISASTVTSTTAKITWPELASGGDTVGYNVYKDGTMVATVGLSSGVTIPGLSPSTTYAFSVRSKDAGTGVSLSSNVLNITTTA